jgi:NADH-quinone oxidoreductase subunit J
MIEAVLFYFFSFVAICAAFGVILARNPITSALSLVVCFFFLAADYVMLGAHFVAVIQILVYAGAIMVLFVFVIMLLNLREEGPAPIGDLGRRAILGAGVAGLLGIGFIAGLDTVANTPDRPLPDGFGTIANVGLALFGGNYLLPFETVSVLLTVAMIGAVVLAKKEI